MANYKRGKRRNALKKENIFRKFKYKRINKTGYVKTSIPI